MARKFPGTPAEFTGLTDFSLPDGRHVQLIDGKARCECGLVRARWDTLVRHRCSTTNLTRQRAREQERAKQKEKFLDTFARFGIVLMAAKAAGVSRQTPYDWYDADPVFRAGWISAKESATDLMEAEAFRRGIQGVERPVFGSRPGEGTVEVGAIREYSDRLLEMMLKANRPDKYRERHEITGKDGGPIRHALEDLPTESIIAEAEGILRRARERIDAGGEG